MKKKDFWVGLAALVLGLVLILWGPRIEVEQNVEAAYLEGEVVSASLAGAVQTLDVEVGEEVVQVEYEPFLNQTHFEEGDRVVLSIYTDPLSGQDTYVINDQVRRPAIYAALVLFLVVVLSVSGWQGARALLGMVFSFVVLIRLVLPLLLSSFLPFASVLLGVLLILPVLFYLSHGVSRKTSVAMLSTLLTLGVTTVLVLVFTQWANLSGTSSEEASFLMLGQLGDQIDFKVILLTGILLSLIGVLDDVCLSQASIVQELKALKKKDLFKSAMRVGRDHIASLVNTLILVYAGASLPLILLFFEYQQPIEQILNLEFMAEEILRMLLASMGLVLAVPITTLLAIWLIGEGHKSADDDGWCRGHRE